MASEAELQTWWDRRSEDEKALLKRAAGTYPLDSAVTKLLIDARCPAVPVGTSWETQDGYAFNMPSELGKFIDSQLDDS